MIDGTHSQKRHKLWGWARFLALLEAALFALALIGPGRHTGARRGAQHDDLAELFVDDPSFWQTLGINFLWLNVFIFVVLVAAALVTRYRKRG